jgi:hypothetical protein
MFGRIGRRTALSFVGVTLPKGACTASVAPTAPAQSGQASASPTLGVPVGIVYLDGTVPTDAALLGVAVEVVAQLP